MKKHLGSLAASVCLGLCLALLFALCPTAAAGQDLQTVRVGFFAFDGYHMLDENGQPSGYGYELLQRMVGYTDWELEYIGYDKSWSEIQDMLEKGQIDLLTSAQRTPERLERFDFSRESIGTSAAILTVKAGDERYLLKDYANWSGMRVGMLENNSRNDDFAGFAAAHGFTYTPVFFNSTNDMVAALKDGGSIDAVVTSNLRSIDGEWVLAQFNASPFYIMVQKGNTQLLDEINAALEQLNTDDTELRSQLMNKYYTPDNGDEIAFTIEERNFIQDMKDTSFAAVVSPDRIPLSYVEDGQPAGILTDIAREIISRSQLNIEFLPVEDRPHYRELVSSGEADIRFDAMYYHAAAEAQGYRLTVPYLDISISRLYHKANNDFTTVALLEGSDIAVKYHNYFQENYEELVYYSSVDEVVEAVLTRQQDLAYLYRHSADLAVYNDVTNVLIAESLYGYDTSFAVAVSARQSHLLYSIINKAVASISQQDIEAIDQRYAAKGERPFSLKAFLYDYPLQSVGLAAGVIIVAGLIILVAYQSRNRKREYAKLQEEMRRGQLLTDALAAAEQANAAKSQFLSRVSHEMRTPLNAIIGFMTLAKSAEPEQVGAYLSNSEIAARQLLSVINDVLDMSSISSGKMRIASAPFDFKHMLHGITNIYVAQCQEKGLQYETKLLTPVDEWLVGDQLRVNQILMNLLGNAVKFTTEGHIWLSISQFDPQDDKVFIRFQVADSGCGMSEEMQERLFKPFEQENSTTAQKYGGNGLGLSIVKSLVTMMGGAIRVDSSPGQGSTFTVDLPFGRSQPENCLEIPEGIQDLRVLVVDDEATELEYVSVVLGRMGLRHTCISTGEAALAELEQAEAAGDSYNICLVDWKMPDMNGIDTTRSIRSKYGSDVVVIVLSAYEHYQADANAREAGANMFISKPLFQSSLFDLFMNLTGGRIARKEAETTSSDLDGKRVLLAEDNAMNRMVATGLIKKFGIECDTAIDGQIAADKFISSENGYYDAILMDIQMPNLDGFAATRLIRASAHPQAASIPIIALTANAFTEDIAKTLSSGMNAHVAKPIEPELLLAALSKVLGK